MQKFVKKFVVVQKTGFVSYYAYSWDGVDVRWISRRDLAKQFSRSEAQTITDTLNAQRPLAINPVAVQPA